VIFLGKSLLQEQISPWALILTKPVPEVFEFCPADWPEMPWGLSALEENFHPKISLA